LAKAITATHKKQSKKKKSKKHKSKKKKYDVSDTSSSSSNGSSSSSSSGSDSDIDKDIVEKEKAKTKAQKDLVTAEKAKTKALKTELKSLKDSASGKCNPTAKPTPPAEAEEKINKLMELTEGLVEEVQRLKKAKGKVEVVESSGSEAEATPTKKRKKSKKRKKTGSPHSTAVTQKSVAVRFQDAAKRKKLAMEREKEREDHQAGCNTKKGKLNYLRMACKLDNGDLCPDLIKDAAKMYGVVVTTPVKTLDAIAKEWQKQEEEQTIDDQEGDDDSDCKSIFPLSRYGFLSTTLFFNLDRLYLHKQDATPEQQLKLKNVFGKDTKIQSCFVLECSKMYLSYSTAARLTSVATAELLRIQTAKQDTCVLKNCGFQSRNCLHLRHIYVLYHRLSGILNNIRMSKDYTSLVCQRWSALRSTLSISILGAKSRKSVVHEAAEFISTFATDVGVVSRKTMSDSNLLYFIFSVKTRNWYIGETMHLVRPLSHIRVAKDYRKHKNTGAAQKVHRKMFQSGYRQWDVLIFRLPGKISRKEIEAHCIRKYLPSMNVAGTHDMQKLQKLAEATPLRVWNDGLVAREKIPNFLGTTSVIQAAKIPTITLFSGCGGADSGLAAVGGIDIKLAIEWDKSAADTHRRHFPHVPVIELELGLDIKETARVCSTYFSKSELKFLYIHASPPCNKLSNANKDRNVEEGMDLIYWTLDLIAELNAKVWTIENVPIMAKRLEAGSVEPTHRKAVFATNQVYKINQVSLHPTSRMRAIASNIVVEWKIFQRQTVCA